MLTVGVAMLQGARNEHMYSLRKAAQNLDMEISIRELRKSTDVDGVDAIVLRWRIDCDENRKSLKNLYNEIWEKPGTILFLFLALVRVQFYSLNRAN